jgi:D-alanyl-D-alanine carboxypeptidase
MPALMLLGMVLGLPGKVEAAPSATVQTQLDAILREGVAGGLPGVVVAAHRDGEEPITSVAGVSSREAKTPLAATGRFRIYSITKTFTAVVVLQLVQEEKLSLDDTVLAVLPSAAETGIPYLDRITIRQLLNHTSGIYDYFDDTDSPFLEDAFLGEHADWSKIWTPQELLAYANAARHAPYFAPGAGYHYSNTNYILLGMIVERVTGQTFGDELQARILDPLGLTATSLPMGAQMPAGTVDGHQELDGELVNVSATNTTWAWSAGGIVSTASDVLRFADALFAGKLLGPEMQREMMPSGAAQADGSTVGFGLFGGPTPHGPAIGNDGGSAGFLSKMISYPDQGLTVVALTNVFPADDAAFAKVVDEATGVLIS